MRIPNELYLKPCFWSYRTEDLDTKTHKTLIIKQVLEYGDIAATDWLESVYSRDEIINVITGSMTSEWSKKTLNYLEVMYGVAPDRQTRFA